VGKVVAKMASGRQEVSISGR